jgi:pyruvate dehydrogenase E2 component (dihydrolipoamide acetyltransferase)
VPPALEAVINKMMAKKPVHRYQVPGAVVEALRPWTDQPFVPPADEEGGTPQGPAALEAGGRRLRYLRLGPQDGLPILFLHGFGADLNTWMFTQPALAEGRRVFALDLPGHGGSAKEVGPGDIVCLTDAAEGAAAALGIERVHLVGHSMGGAIAASLAQRRPEAVATLTLIASAGLGPEINMAFIDGFVRASRRREAVEVLGLLVNDPALVSRTMIEDVLRFKRLDGVAAALATIVEAWFKGGRQSFDLAGQIAALEIPVQIIWGAEDRIIPVAHAKAFLERKPVHILEQAGHLPHMEKAGEVNRLVKRFIES